MPLIVPAREFQSGTNHYLIAVVPKGTLVTKDGGRPYRTRVAVVATTITILDGEVAWQTLKSDAYFSAACEDVLLYDTDHQHVLQASTSFSGGSPIRGGGSYRKAKGRCRCGWQSRGNVHTAEVKDQWVEHLHDTAQVCAWLASAEPLELHVNTDWDEKNPGPLSTWQQALDYLSTRPSHRQNIFLKSPTEGVTGEECSTAASAALPGYLLES